MHCYLLDPPLWYCPLLPEAQSVGGPSVSSNTIQGYALDVLGASITTMSALDSFTPYFNTPRHNEHLTLQYGCTIPG